MEQINETPDTEVVAVEAVAEEDQPALDPQVSEPTNTEVVEYTAGVPEDEPDVPEIEAIPEPAPSPAPETGVEDKATANEGTHSAVPGSGGVYVSTGKGRVKKL